MPVPCSLVRRMATGICWHYTVYEKMFLLSQDKASMQPERKVFRIRQLPQHL